MDDESAFDLPNFVPVPVRERDDGWTAMRQVAFVEALAQTGCVNEAARSVGMTARSAYKLRQHSGAVAFRAAWTGAIDFAMQRLADVALSRAINGVARPIVHKGEIIGERRFYDERLTQFLLRTRAPERFGRWIDRVDEWSRKHADSMGVSMSLLTLEVARDDGILRAPPPAARKDDDDDDDDEADLT